MRDVGHRERVAAKVRVLREMRVRHLEVTGEFFPVVFDFRHIAFFGRRADQDPEHRFHVIPQRGAVPLHPAVGSGCCLWIFGA